MTLQWATELSPHGPHSLRTYHSPCGIDDHDDDYLGCCETPVTVVYRDVWFSHNNILHYKSDVVFSKSGGGKNKNQDVYGFGNMVHGVINFRFYGIKTWPLISRFESWDCQLSNGTIFVGKRYILIPFVAMFWLHMPALPNAVFS